MAEKADNLPDLWALAQHLLQRLRRLLQRRTSPRAPPAQERQQEAPSPLAPGSRQQPAKARDTAAGWQVHQMPRTRLLPARPEAKPRPAATGRALSEKLRQPGFLRQAVVVNEILNKPLALRPRRQKPQPTARPSKTISNK